MLKAIFGKKFSHAFLMLFACCVFGFGQQPFLTDDADVTERGKFHFEFANEFDKLQASALPVKYQNAARVTLAYGLARNLEISVGGQFLTLASRDRPRYTSGFGDSTIGIKYNFLREGEKSWRPALTVSSFVQFPTGEARRGLGSGIRDFGINGIAQKTFVEKTVARVNVGTIFSGNTVTGALGIRSSRGKVFTGGASLVRTITEKLQLGAEVTGAAALSDGLSASKKQLQTQFGGNYQFRKNASLDFGFIVGRFAASPRFGLQIGTSIDF